MYERIEVVFTSLFLVPSRLLPMPGVLWTLKHEIFFYTLFAFAIWKPKLGVVALVTWFILCISHVSASGSTGFLLDFCASLYSIEFMLGVGCGIALRSFRVPLPAMMIAAGGLLFGLAGASFEAVKSAQPWIANGTTLSQVAQFGLASVLIVLGVGQMDVDRKTVVPSAIGLLGSASYSIYLIHYPTISVCCKILKRLTPAMPLTPIVASVIVVLISVTTGIMLHKWVEVPLMKAFRPKKHRLDNENLADRTRENVARNGFDEG